jgi:hypothetical protein
MECLAMRTLLTDTIELAALAAFVGMILLLTRAAPIV